MAMAFQARLLDVPKLHSHFQHSSRMLFPGLITKGSYIPLRKISLMPMAVNGKDNLPIFEQGQQNGIPTYRNGSLSLSKSKEKQSLMGIHDFDDLEDEVSRMNSASMGNLGDDPYRVLDSGRKIYLDELDVLTLLDPPSFLVPIDANSYDQAAYLGKKIEDIPENRRHRLLDLLTPKQVASMWDIAGQGNRGPNSEPGNVLLGSESEFFMKPVKWIGKVFNAPWPLNWFSKFEKVFFLSNDGSVYGRVVAGGDMARWLFPLYIEARETRKVVFTEEACNIALEYGDGQLHLADVPKGFPKPGRHPWPFNDASVDYLRPVGPGVLVGQWWIEGKELEQIPEKRADFVMVRDYENKSSV